MSCKSLVIRELLLFVQTDKGTTHVTGYSIDGFFFYGTQVKSRQLRANTFDAISWNGTGKSLNSIVKPLSQCFWLTSDAPSFSFKRFLLVYVIAVNVRPGGNTPYTRDSLLPRSIVSMLTSFPLNAGVAELKNLLRCYTKCSRRHVIRLGLATYPHHCLVTRSIAPFCGAGWVGMLLSNKSYLSSQYNVAKGTFEGMKNPPMNAGSDSV